MFLGDQVQERRFTAAVRAYDCDAVALEYFHREVGDELRTHSLRRAVIVTVGVCEMQSLDLEHSLAGETRFGKAEIQVPFVREALTGRKLCRRLDFGLHHGGLRCLVTEAFDDAFELFFFALLVFLRAHRHFFFFGDGLAELFDGTLHLAHLVAVNADRMRADFVHKVVVVRNQQHFALPCA